MRNLPPLHRPALLLALVASTALASEREQLAVRTLLLSEHPNQATHRVYVRGQVVTVLRFERPVDAGRTKLLAWEGRFEPLGVVGRKVVLEPLRDLAPDEGVPLLVTLEDGTEVALLLRPPALEDWARTDQQVNVFKDRDAYEAMFSTLMDALREKRALKSENERLRKEETSEDHALAALLVAGAITQTPFVVSTRLSAQELDSNVDALLMRGKGKVALILKVKNLDAQQSWSVRNVRLVTTSSGQERTVAVRSSAPSLPPGTSGVVALVVDASAFIENGALTSLFLEVYRHDGLRQAFVELDPSLLGE